MTTDNGRRKVLLIGWDAADWKVIHPLMDDGKMPHLNKLVDGGTMANLATLHPVLSPMLWTSISTGKRPFKHGIHGFSEPSPDGSHIRPMTTMSRKTKALWNILTQNDITSNVVGWWPSNPAEPIKGAMVSNLFQQAVGPPEKPWPVKLGSVHPPRLTKALASLRLNPNELTGEHLFPFVPRVGEIDQQADRRLASVGKITAECTTVHSVATWLMENEPWDFMAVYYDAIDHYCHGFMKYHPPRQPHIAEKDFDLYKDVVNQGYIYHDMMLGRLIELAGEDTTVMLISDHGFHPDHLRPRAIPNEPAGPAHEHRDLGILVMHGPGIRQDHLISGPNLLDIAPTILTLFGLPVGADMDGTAIVEAFEQKPAIETIESWDQVPGEAGTHPPELAIGASDSREAIAQLVALGYIDKPSDNIEQAVRNTNRELQYNLAQSLMDGQQHAEAAEIFEELYEQWPWEHRFGFRLSVCYLALDRIAELRHVVSQLAERRKFDAEASQQELAEYIPRMQDRIKQVESDDSLSSEEKKQLVKPTAQEQATLRQLRGRANYNREAINYLWACVHMGESNFEQAAELLEEAGKCPQVRPALLNRLGQTWLKLRQADQAESSFRKALEIDPLDPHATLGLARCELRRRHPKRAVEFARKSCGLQYSHAYAHFILGIGLHRIREIEAAAESFRTAISINPNFPQAHRRLARILKFRFHDEQAAREHRKLADEMTAENKRRKRVSAAQAPPTGQLPPRKSLLPSEKKTGNQPTVDPSLPVSGEIIVVSGLPRSGTSMLMQMLTAGGIEPISDGIRAADEDNPLGYLEFEATKRLQSDRSWVGKAVGKSLKVIAHMVPFLPANFTYKIICLHRDLDEVIASQSKMLLRNGEAGADLSDASLKACFQKQMEQLERFFAKAPHIEMLRLCYNDVLKDPVLSTNEIGDFLNRQLQLQPMVEVVRPELYRSRSGHLSDGPSQNT